MDACSTEEENEETLKQQQLNDAALDLEAASIICLSYNLEITVHWSINIAPYRYHLRCNLYASLISQF